MSADNKDNKELIAQDPFEGLPVLDDQDLADFASTGNLGDRDFEQGDLTYGWLKISQTNSQVATRGHAKYIPGLEPGKFYDTLTNTIFGDSVELIYLKSFRSYLVMKGKKGEGEYVKTLNRADFKLAFDSGEIVQVEGDGLRMPELPDHYVQETVNYMVIEKNHPEIGIMRFSLGMGSIRQCKIWNTVIGTALLPGGRPAPKWAYAWKLSLSLDSDGAKHSYWNIGTGGKANVTRSELVQQPLRSLVIKSFKFFQETSDTVIDNAGRSEYTNNEDGDDPL